MYFDHATKVRAVGGMVGGNDINEAPKPVAEVPERLSALSFAIGRLDEATGVLFDRIIPITRPNGPEPDRERGLNQTNPVPPQTALGNELADFASRIDSLTQRVYGVLSRLGV